MGDATRRVTRRTARVTATERFHAESRRRKAGPAAVLVGIIGVAFAAAVAFILVGGGPSLEQIQDELDARLSRAYQEERAGRIEPALACYREALSVIGEDERFRSKAIEIRGTIRAREQGLAEAAERTREMAARRAAFLKEAEVCSDSDVPFHLRRGRDLRKDHETCGLAWPAEAEASLKKLESRLRPPFEVVKRRIRENRKIADLKAADFSGALADWRQYLEGKPSADDRARTDAEMRQINLWAKEELERIRRAVGRHLDSSERSEAAELLKNERPRFQGTLHAAAFDAILRP